MKMVEPGQGSQDGDGQEIEHGRQRDDVSERSRCVDQY